MPQGSVVAMTTTTETPIPDTSAAASVSGAVKVYGKGNTSVRALDGVDLVLPRGGFTAVMGPSGSGKSTLMHCMAGLDTLTEGSAQIGGERLETLKDAALTKLRRRKVGFIFQAFNLIQTLTGRENIELPLRLDGEKPDAKWFHEVVSRLGIEDRLDHTPTELSGGQIQRVAVARALVSRPDVIFADEPTGNLDTTSGAEVLALMRAAVDEYGQTIVMVTHDPNSASVADRVLFLFDGRIVDSIERPTADAVFERMRTLSSLRSEGVS
ncbi:MAG: peptide transporter ATP-binding protein [Thermoleophilia bacterium]|nr:peptide transporter ATP-binding protein [Thermoleophilia bacterium]